MEIASIIDGSVGRKWNPGATYDQLENALERAGYELERKSDYVFNDAGELHRGVEVRDALTGQTLAEYGLAFDADTESEEAEIKGLIAADHAISDSPPYGSQGTNPIDPRNHF
jgi:hypothetical protein